MKLIIVFAGIQDELEGWPDQRSLALQRLAGSNVLGHILEQLNDIKPAEVIVIADGDEKGIAAWIADNNLEAAVSVASDHGAQDPLQALVRNQERFGQDDLLFVFGNYITEADFKDLTRSPADVTPFTKPQLSGDPEAVSTWAGVCYFRSARELRGALAEAAASNMQDFSAFLAYLKNSDLHVVEQQADMCLDTSTTAGLLHANARLLGLGYGSEDAIERSYAEDFTVIPPVFLHETAVIENAVVGPFVNVEAGVKLIDSIVRRSLIGANSLVESAILDGSLLGDRAYVRAASHALLLNSDKEIEL